MYEAKIQYISGAKICTLTIRTQSRPVIRPHGCVASILISEVVQRGAKYQGLSTKPNGNSVSLILISEIGQRGKNVKAWAQNPTKAELRSHF